MPRPFRVRRSRIHGNGVFATADIPAGTELIEYTGKLITRKEADELYDEMYSGHTFLMELTDDWIIDANQGGNDARWINHSCAPNCIPYQHEHPTDPLKTKVIIETIRDIRAGEELTYDYGISFDVPYTARLKKIWACHCGAPNCTGTMLKPVEHERWTGEV
ncbi:MAG: SET domain-containing protein-lysine N-methyltransferase [Flavobacteriales bacterium]|nr:SET domain-containing protein-lysine N-methyltransferase [Flavobacteriales bacterium]MEB2340659.1 SET domain-containing protein-lysine N-methyltransferase [Flavobacteriia bacterium]